MIIKFRTDRSGQTVQKLLPWKSCRISTFRSESTACPKPPYKPKACILLQWNTETHKLHRKINLWKFTKSKRFSCFTCFETDWNMMKINEVWTFQLFRNISKQTETRLWKRWKYQAPLLVFWKLKQWIILGNYWNRLKHEENWLSPNVSVVSKQTRSGKGENTRPHIWCFETLKPWII